MKNTTSVAVAGVALALIAVVVSVNQMQNHTLKGDISIDPANSEAIACYVKLPYGDCVETRWIREIGSNTTCEQMGGFTTLAACNAAPNPMSSSVSAMRSSARAYTCADENDPPAVNFGTCAEGYEQVATCAPPCAITTPGKIRCQRTITCRRIVAPPPASSVASSYFSSSIFPR